MGEEQKSEESKKPDFKGFLDVVGWTNKDKNGKEYIQLKISQYCRLYKEEKK